MPSTRSPAARSRANGERRVDAGRGDDVRGGGEMAQRAVDGRQAPRVGHGVQIVQHEDQLALVRDRGVHEVVDGVLHRAAAYGEALQIEPPEPGADSVDRRGDVTPEPRRVVVAVVERDPGEPGVACCTRRAHRRRLSVSRRRGDEGELGPVSGVERPRDTSPSDRVRPDARRCELRLDQERALVGFRSCSALRGVCGHRSPILPAPNAEPLQQRDAGLRSENSLTPRPRSALSRRRSGRPARPAHAGPSETWSRASCPH
jgi:hypothetical protein